MKDNDKEQQSTKLKDIITEEIKAIENIESNNSQELQKTTNKVQQNDINNDDVQSSSKMSKRYILK
jgi:hypothetical protein